MRITVLGQFVKGLMKLDPNIGGEMEHELERTKWKLWHGNVPDALEAVEDLAMLMWAFEDSYLKFKAFAKCVREFERYLKRNQRMIVNYGERWRAGEVISTAFVESTVNSLLDKRFTKRQQMQWTPKGAHLLLQIRTRVINDDLAQPFRVGILPFEKRNNALLRSPWIFMLSQKDLGPLMMRVEKPKQVGAFG
jgi:hypothetical protein